MTKTLKCSSPLGHSMAKEPGSPTAREGPHSHPLSDFHYTREDFLDGSKPSDLKPEGLHQIPRSPLVSRVPFVHSTVVGWAIGTLKRSA